MAKVSTYRVRVLHSYPYMKDTIFDNLSYQEACERFMFYVACCLEFPELNVRCVNIFKGKKCFKYFCNYD